MNRRTRGRRIGSAIRPRACSARVDQPDRAYRSDRDAALSAPGCHQRRAAHRLGEAGSVPCPTCGMAGVTHAGRRCGAGKQSRAGAALASLALRSMPIRPSSASAAWTFPAPVAIFAMRMVEINVLLAVFNMVPIPPLDGGNVLAGVLPGERAPDVRRAQAVRISDYLRAHADRRPGGVHQPRPTTSCSRGFDEQGHWTSRLRHASDREAAPRPPGRGARNWQRCRTSTSASTSSPTGTR